MGREGSALCHCLYAWAVSYGVDERGQPEATEADPLSATSLVPSENENKRQTERQHRKEKTYHVVRTILREIDDYGIMRKPSWDGVRVLLLVLPLTEGMFLFVGSKDICANFRPRSFSGASEPVPHRSFAGVDAVLLPRRRLRRAASHSPQHLGGRRP